MTLNISFNGSRCICELEKNNLQHLLTWKGYEDGFYAVAVNHQFIPRSLHATHYLKDGDTVEVVIPMQGG